MSMISMNDLFYGLWESVQILKDEDREILETIHRYNYFYAEPPPKPEVSEEDEEESEDNAKGVEQLMQDEKKAVIEKSTNVPDEDGKVILKVPMCCSECEDTVTIVLKNVSGVDDVVTSQQKQMVIVTGNAAPVDILLACRDLKIFRKTQFWSDIESE